jgi:hypothetical protein
MRRSSRGRLGSSRSKCLRAGPDLKELGEHLAAGQVGLVVVAVADMGAKVEQAMTRAAKLEQKQIEDDLAGLERDAASVGHEVDRAMPSQVVRQLGPQLAA